MKSRNFRTFEVDGVMCIFSTEGFKRAIDRYRTKLKEEGKPSFLKDISDEISAELNISVEALSNWRKGYNGPSDLDRVKEIASVLQCDYKELLDAQGGNAQMVIKEVNFSVATTEKEALKSIIYDLLEVVEYFGKTNGFRDWVIIDRMHPENNEEIDFDEWFARIRIKMRRSEFEISKENTEKIEKLLLETMAFVDGGISRRTLHWESICKGFRLNGELGEILDDEMIDTEYMLNGDEYLDEDLKEYLRSELDDYIQGDYSYDYPAMVIGYRIGAWYMEVVREYFPELFAD